MNEELAAIYAADQADRNPLPRVPSPEADAAYARDRQRLARVTEILDGGGAQTAEDYWHAAMVFQHGHSVEEAGRANALARRAVALEPTHAQARWLVCASEDRLLMRQGKPQRWGTQFHFADGRWQLWPVDGSVDDAERAVWNVPPLAEAERRAATMSR